jgi:hypothetical protein
VLVGNFFDNFKEFFNKIWLIKYVKRMEAKRKKSQSPHSPLIFTVQYIFKGRKISTLSLLCSISELRHFSLHTYSVIGFSIR